MKIMWRRLVWLFLSMFFVTKLWQALDLPHWILALLAMMIGWYWPSLVITMEDR